ncbi:hypothetical protein [Cryobacterium arcticum]|uniref:Uncharacterized protein n=1 Tax=Cryobacterium arcticum TaxID=670052 RepID=A0A317ZRA5_9MICO|nr:hypothetical protein [Cryobacterium arcticum]PXA68388.1 hypothetical protein CTB96_17420 [Cryobacterium arcticum]
MRNRKSRANDPKGTVSVDRAWWSRSPDRGGYPGLEGDFESERRRAAAASDEKVEPYEHGEGATAVLPVTEPGQTHP